MEIIVNSQQLRKELTRYRVFAWITGIMLLILIACMIYKYVYIPIYSPGTVIPTWLKYIPTCHGWCYACYLVCCSILAIHMRWPLPKILLTLLAGTIPFLSFVAEHYRTKEVQAVIAALERAETT